MGSEKGRKPLFDGVNLALERSRESGVEDFHRALKEKLSFVTRLVVVGLAGCLEEGRSHRRYATEYRIVRADAPHQWTEILMEMLGERNPDSHFTSGASFVRELDRTLDRKGWGYNTARQIHDVALRLDPHREPDEPGILADLFAIGSGILEGSGEPDGETCDRLCNALSVLEHNLALFRLSWAYLHRNLSGKYRVLPLLNDLAPFEYLKRIRDAELPNGVYLNLTSPEGIHRHCPVPLLRVDPENDTVWLPDGGYRDGNMDWYSCSTGRKETRKEARWDLPARNPGESRNAGGAVLEPIGNAFANLPPMPPGYISRQEPEEHLQRLLRNLERHAVVTLAGASGCGKSLLALDVLHDLCRLNPAPYDVFLWISAQDMDLLDDGPERVRRKVCTREDVAMLVARLITSESPPADPVVYLENCLRNGASGTTLFVFDSFDTLDDPPGVFRWVDTHIRPPNKVLITTRHRDFAGDYPVRIAGMTDEESSRLAEEHLYQAGIADRVEEDGRRRILQEADGHPYIIKLLLGEAARAGKVLDPKRVTSEAGSLLEALFGRVYRSLSPGAQRIFLVLCSWRVYLPEVALETVPLRPGTELFDVAAALEEVVQSGLVEARPTDQDRSRFVGVPMAAGMFGQRILVGDPVRHTIEKDKQFLMEFGAGQAEDAARGTLARIEPLVRAAVERAAASPESLGDILPVLEHLASRVPSIYLRLAGLVMERLPDKLSMARDYYRLYLPLSELSERRRTWLDLAECCKRLEDWKEEIFARCEASLVPTTTNDEISLDANQLNGRIRELKHAHVAMDWTDEKVRGSIQCVIREMESRLPSLTATDCSRLAWLHLNLGNVKGAHEIATEGAGRESGNPHCRSLIDRLDAQQAQARN